MSYDLFISYSRRDNADGRITQLVKRIKANFEAFGGRPERSLQVFFDENPEDGIKGMEDWRHKILQGLRKSRLLLACLSPSYLQSEYCEWEFNEYLKYEICRAYFGDGVAPIYFVQVPGWEDKNFDQQCAAWVAELRRRQHFDLRSWFRDGEKSLRDATVQNRMRQLNDQLKERITRGEQAELSLGNVDAHNRHFIGRTSELRRLRETVGLGKLGMFSIVHGLGGVGKTALAIEYAHAFAHEYGGGRWQVRCEKEVNLHAAITTLASPLGIDFTDAEKTDPERQFERILRELKKLVDDNEPHQCLIILDNVDKPEFLEPAQTKRILSAQWLHIIATSRLGESDLHGTSKDRSFLPVDELPEADAVKLIESHQPGNIFPTDAERKAALEIVRLLGGFTLAVETAAAYLGQFAHDVNCIGFLARLKKEGIEGLDNSSQETSEGVRHGEKRLLVTLAPTLERLTECEKLALSYAALLPPDHIALPWIRALIAEKFPKFATDVEPGHPDPWLSLLRRLLSLRLFQVENVRDARAQLHMMRMHRLLSELITKQDQSCIAKNIEMRLCMGRFIFMRANDLSKNHQGYLSLWEIDCLFRTTLLSVLTGQFLAQRTAISCCSALRDAGRYAHAIELARATIDARSHGKSDTAVSSVWLHNMAGVCALHLGDSTLAETYFRQAHALLGPTIVDGGDQLDTLTNLGCLLRETFRPKDSFGPCSEALALAERLYNHNAPEVGICCINLGLVLQDLCRLNEAISLFERALEIDRGRPELILSTCQDMGTLAEALRCASRDNEAEAIAQEAVQLAAKHGYGNHTISAGLNTTLAWTIEDQGDFEEARVYLQSALELTTNCFGDSTPLLAACFNNLGLNSLCSGYHNRALQELERALEIEGQRSNPNAQKLALRELNLSVAFLMANDLAEARVHLMSGWKHKGETNTPDLLVARLLLVRLAVALLSGESADLFMGQIATLLEEDCLPAAGVNIRWRLENLLLTLIAPLPTEYSVYWYRAYNSIKTKMDPRGKQEQRTADGIPARDLKERWPGG